MEICSLLHYGLTRGRCSRQDRFEQKRSILLSSVLGGCCLSKMGSSVRVVWTLNR
jgi:hypothetical protein